MKNKILIFPERGTIQDKKDFFKKADSLIKKGKGKYIFTLDMVNDNLGNIKPTNLSKQK